MDTTPPQLPNTAKPLTVVDCTHIPPPFVCRLAHDAQKHVGDLGLRLLLVL